MNKKAIFLMIFLFIILGIGGVYFFYKCGFGGNNFWKGITCPKGCC